MKETRKRGFDSPLSSSDPHNSPTLTSTHKKRLIELSPKIKSLFEIVSTTPSLSVEKALEDSGIRVAPEDVEEILKLSYGLPGQAVKFFRWSGYQLNNNHTRYSWNLVIDLLGKSRFFDAMWDAMKSMRKEKLLSLATFASVFGSYVAAGQVHDAIMAFEVMDAYGCDRNVVALNSLLSAICRDSRTLDACDYLQAAKKFLRPDPDTYAILMEGWEKEGSVLGSKETFAEMVIEMGWDAANVPAYDSFLCTLIKGPDGLLEAIKFFDSMRDKRCYPGMRFLKVAVDECVKSHDIRTAKFFWDVMVEKARLQPSTQMYNSMVSLCCYHNDTNSAMKMLDDMVYKGSFPDSLTYNLLFRFLIKGRKLREASAVFAEMIKNECVPDQPNCDAAVKVYIDNKEPHMAIKVWKWMVENYDKDLEAKSKFLILGLCDQNRVPEAVKYAEDMIGRGIKLSSSTMSKLRHSLVREGKEFAYEELLRKWKSH